jgi:prolyl oligopeptidase PreP (S9A serine peptidase family)
MNEEVIGKAVEKDIKEIDDLDELINTKFKFLKNNKKFSQILEQFSEPITLMALKEEGKQVEHYLESTMQFDSDYHKANVFVGSSMFLSALCRCSDVYFEKHGFFIEDF